MKRILLFITMLFMALGVFAQRAAVMEFENTSGISLAEANTISAAFATYFQPAGYTMVERVLLDKILEEQKIQGSNITEEQRVKLNDLYNISIIVTGHISYFGGYYTVDVRVISAQSGVRLVSDGQDFSASNMREQMKALSQRVAAEIAVPQGSIVRSNTSASQASEYVDLGLPSGTLWKSKNEKGMYYSWGDAMSQFGDKMPTREQFAELQAFCTWEWTGKGYKVTGDNGNYVVFPAAGYRYCDGNVNGVGSSGDYWSSTPDGSEYAYYLCFDSDRVDMYGSYRCYGLSVRLVQD